MARRVGGRNGGPELDAMNLVLGDGFDEMHEAHWRRAWERCRGEYMSPEYLAQHPGSRVWAWWMFDAPEDIPEDVGPATGDHETSGAVEDSHRAQVATIAFLHDRGFLHDVEREALVAEVRELEAGGYGEFDPHGSMAHALARAQAAGASGLASQPAEAHRGPEAAAARELAEHVDERLAGDSRG